MRPDDGDGVKARGNQGQNSGLVLEQDDAAFFDFAGNGEADEGIHNAALAWEIDYSGGKHGAENAVHMLVELGLGNCPCFDGSLVFGLVEEAARLFVIEAGGGSFFG